MSTDAPASTAGAQPGGAQPPAADVDDVDVLLELAFTYCPSPAHTSSVAAEPAAQAQPTPPVESDPAPDAPADTSAGAPVAAASVSSVASSVPPPALAAPEAQSNPAAAAVATVAAEPAAQAQPSPAAVESDPAHDASPAHTSAGAPVAACASSGSSSVPSAPAPEPPAPEPPVTNPALPPPVPPPACLPMRAKRAADHVDVPVKKEAAEEGTASAPPDAAAPAAAPAAGPSTGASSSSASTSERAQGKPTSAGVFWWTSRGAACRSPAASTAEEAARIRDRLIVACQELDALEGRTQRAISNRNLKFPRSDYEGEPFVAAIRRGELRVERDDDPFAAVLDFLRSSQGAIPREAGAGGSVGRGGKARAKEPQPPKPGAKTAKSAAAAARAKVLRGAAAARAKAAGAPQAAEMEAAPRKKEAAKKKQSSQEAPSASAAEKPPKAAVRKPPWRRGPGGLKGITARKGMFEGRFVWRGKEVTTKPRRRKEEAARIRDRLLIACKWLDEKEGRSAQLGDDAMNSPVSAYKREAWYKALQRGELEAKGGDGRAAVYEFLRAHGAYPKAEADGPTTRKRKAPDETAAPPEGDGPPKAKPRSEADGAPAGATLKGVSEVTAGGSYRGQFSWRGWGFYTTCNASPVEAARERDRLILTCQWLDSRVKHPKRIPDSRLSFPREEYEQEAFYAALRRGELKTKSVELSELRPTIRRFVEKRTKREAGETCRLTAARPDPPSATAAKEAEPAPSGGESGGRDAEAGPAQRSVEADRESRQRWRNLLRNPRACEFVYEHEGRFVAGFHIQDEPIISPHFDTAEAAKRFVDRCRVAWCGPEGEARHSMRLFFPVEEYRRDSFYRKLFAGPRKARLPIGDNNPNWKEDTGAAVRETVQFVMDEMGLTPTFGLAPQEEAEPAAAPAAANKKKRGRASAPGGSSSSPPVAQPVTRSSAAADAASASASTPPKPSRKRQRTAGAGEPSQPPAPPPAPCCSPPPDRVIVVAGPGASPLPAPFAPSVEDPTTLLRWTPPMVLEWFRDVFTLDAESPALRALRRLELNGRALVLRPACALRERLRRLAGPEANEASKDALEAVLDSLDQEVRLLAEHARRCCADPALAAELDARMQSRGEEAARLARAPAGRQ